MDIGFLTLHFFRDFSSRQRALVFIKLKMLPSNYKDSLPHGIEQLLIKNLVKKNRISELKLAMDEIHLMPEAA